MSTRRTFLGRALGACSALFAAPGLSAQMQMQMPMPATTPAPQAVPPTTQRVPSPAGQTPVITTDVGDLAYTMDGSTKVFHLVAEVVRQKIHPAKTIDLWGFNGSAPGPTMQVNQGDHVRVIFENHLPEPISIHWHGFEDMIGYDGMPGISQEPVKPGARFIYEFDIHQAGTYFYHSHMAMQEMAGMLGGFIMHPRAPYQPHCDKDFLLHLQEYAVLPNNTVPNTMNMEYNWLLLNGKAGPESTPLIVRQGDRVRIRFVNLGMDHHPMHIHGYTFQVTGTEGGRIPLTAWWPGTTVLVGVAQARDIEITADRPGDWMLHCHLPHHMMNQMSSNVGSMTRRPGMPAGLDMDTGMGMLQGTPGAPSGEDYGPSLGRGMGFGSTADMATANGPLGQQQGMASMPGMAQMASDIAANANAVPGFPQDAYMEGPAMAMDQMVEKPENYGLRSGWSGYMMGMMTFMRVLPPQKYEEVIARMKQAQRPNDPYASMLQRIS
jgi:manganese oxidase